MHTLEYAPPPRGIKFIDLNSLRKLCKLSHNINQDEKDKADVFLIFEYAGKESIVHLSLADNLLAFKLSYFFIMTMVFKPHLFYV